jgi:hypothetical protein
MTPMVANCQKSCTAVIVALILAAPVAQSQNVKDAPTFEGVLTEVADIPMPGPAVRFD